MNIKSSERYSSLRVQPSQWAAHFPGASNPSVVRVSESWHPPCQTRHKKAIRGIGSRSRKCKHVVISLVNSATHSHTWAFNSSVSFLALSFFSFSSSPDSFDCFNYMKIIEVFLTLIKWWELLRILCYFKQYTSGGLSTQVIMKISVWMGILNAQVPRWMPANILIRTVRF